MKKYNIPVPSSEDLHKAATKAITETEKAIRKGVDSLHDAFKTGPLVDFWNVLDHKEFPFVTLTSTTNGARNFPPYDIIERSDGNVILKMAVAGYDRDHLAVELEGNTLIIKGLPGSEKEGDVIRHRGISNASFLRTFDMNVNTLIEDVQLKDGILTVFVKSKKPEVKARTSFQIKHTL